MPDVWATVNELDETTVVRECGLAYMSVIARRSA